jgi:hypothetical protein
LTAQPLGGTSATAIHGATTTNGENHDQRINNPFAILLDGVYGPVASGAGPRDNLGLDMDLGDGSYSKVKIYRVSGLPGMTGAQS